MTDERRETRIARPHPSAEQKGLIQDVAVPLAQSGITVGGMIAAAKIAKGGKDDNS
jgi:hypothetical protein